MPERILGISCFFHDSAACLLEGGRILAAAQEERFTRKKHDARFPVNAVNFCLEQARCGEGQIDIVCYYEKPLWALDRIVQTSLGANAEGDMGRLKRLGLSWGGSKLNLEGMLERHLSGFKGRVLYSEHHLSHAASAFFASPFEEAGVLTIDGVGEWAAAAMFSGRGGQLELLGEQAYPHSLGLFYSAFTYFTGFKVNSGEYKFMGLAPYGEPLYCELLKDHVIQVNDDGSIHLNLDYFDFLSGDRMTSPALDGLLGGPARLPESRITQREMDLAASVQKITEEAALKMGAHLKAASKMKRICLAGGVALNCVANGKLLRSGLFEDIWIQPASGDAGGALGAALAAHHIFLGNPRRPPQGADLMRGSALGAAYGAEEICDFLDMYGLPYEVVPKGGLAAMMAGMLEQGNIIGVLQGPMEFGPRALGGRSILADPRAADMQSKVNLRVKFRESFRPFAPMVLREHMDQWFEMDHDSPYMLLVALVSESRRKQVEPVSGEDLIEKVNQVRSEAPAITHVDYSARVQTVHRDLHPLMHEVISGFYEKTGVPVLVNTSFNVRGEPIVCSPWDAYRCMMRTEIDCIFLENVLVRRKDQPSWAESGDWRDEFELD